MADNEDDLVDYDEEEVRVFFLLPPAAPFLSSLLSGSKHHLGLTQSKTIPSFLLSRNLASRNHLRSHLLSRSLSLSF